MKLSTLALLPLLAGALVPAQAQILNIGDVVTSMDAPAAYAIRPLTTESSPTTQRYFSWYYGWARGTDSSLDLVSNPAGSAQPVPKVFRMQVRDVPLSTLNREIRSEVTPAYDRIREGRRWYAASIYLPANWVMDTRPDGWTVVFQVHSSKGVVPDTSPPFAVSILGDNLQLEMRTNHRDDPRLANKENTSAQKVSLGKVQRQKWYCFVLDADWQHLPGKGALRFWVNGNLMYEIKNAPTHYANLNEINSGNYSKTGVYQSKALSVLGTERTIYTDFLHIGGPNSTYTQLAERTPCGSGPGA